MFDWSVYCEAGGGYFLRGYGGGTIYTVVINLLFIPLRFAVLEFD